MIPKNIFTFWHHEILPHNIKVCIDSWKYHCKDAEIHIVNFNNLSNYLEETISFDKLKIQEISDWIRLNLIYKYGGVWMDASIILTENIFKYIKIQREFVGIWNGIRIENCFFASPQKSNIINCWIKEFELAMEDPEKYEIETSEIIEWNKDTYLYHQLCLLKVLNDLKINPYTDIRLSILSCDKFGFPINPYYHFKNWAKEFMFNTLTIGFPRKNIYPLYKFVGFTRKFLNYSLNSFILDNSVLSKSGYVSRNSFFIKFINLIIIIYLGIIHIISDKIQFYIK